MTTLREAAQQALEFIRWGQLIPSQSEPFPEPPSTAPQVEAALRAALAEPVQEPVAWMYDCGGGGRMYAEELDDVPGWAPLFAAPPQRKPLTEEEIQAAWDSVDMRHPRGNETRIAFARAIERAHGIKE